MTAINIPHPFGCDNAALFSSNHLSQNHQYQNWHDLGGELDYMPIVLPSPYQHSVKRPVGSEKYNSSVSDFIREASIPVHQLRNEIPWSGHNSNGSEAPRAKFPATHDTTEAAQSPLSPVGPIEPVKRKRGRPRLEPPYLNTQKGAAIAQHDQPARMTQLEKNRIAADKCRRQRKDYTSKLMAQHASMSAKNETLKAHVAELREQVLELKHEVLQHANCGSWMIDGYVARIASDLSGSARPNNSVETPPSAPVPIETDEADHACTLDPHQRQGSADRATASSTDDDLWFLNYDGVIENQQNP